MRSGAMLVLPFTYHMNQFNTGQNCLCPTERLKSQHRPYSSFDIPVILLNQIVQVLVLPDGHPFFFWFVGVECGQGRRVGATFIDSGQLGFAMMTNGLAKETQRRRPSWRSAGSRWVADTLDALQQEAGN